MLSATAPSGATLSSAPDGLTGRRKIEALFAILVVFSMATLDTAIANTALPTLATSLRVDEASVIWVVNAYQLAVAAVLLPLAASGEVLGHNRIFTTGTIVFTLGSLACGLSDSLPMLIAARVLQGLGAAAVMSVNIALIRFVFPARHMGRGLGLNSFVGAVSVTVGPTVASAILSVASWHWLFLVNVPIGILATALGLRALPATPRENHGFDPLAAVLCGGLFAGAVMGFESLAHGSGWGQIVAEWSAAFACGAVLWRRQAGHPAPILATDLFRKPIFSLSAATAICAFTNQGLGYVGLPFLLQGVLGHDAVETGLLMTPWPAAVAFSAVLAGRLMERFTPSVLASLGLVAMGVGMSSLAMLPMHASNLSIIWRAALCGAGFGFFQAPSIRLMMGSADARRSGSASGVVAAVRLLGQTLGAGLVALCFQVSSANAAHAALWLGCVFSLVGCILSLMRMRPTRPVPPSHHAQ